MIEVTKLLRRMLKGVDPETNQPIFDDKDTIVYDVEVNGVFTSVYNSMEKVTELYGYDIVLVPSTEIKLSDSNQSIAGRIIEKSDYSMKIFIFELDEILEFTRDSLDSTYVCVNSDGSFLQTNGEEL